MKQIIYKLLLFLFVITTVSFELLAQPLPINRWHFIQTDSTSQKRGNWAEPSWLRYFGLDMEYINNDDYKDIISGRYFYMNLGENMEGKWARSDLGMNVDGYLFVDIDGDEYDSIIAEALPDVYWFGTDNLKGTSWSCWKIGEIPIINHVNGQGGRYAQFFLGGKGEVILLAKRGGWEATMHGNPNVQSNWKFNRIFKAVSSAGIGVRDIDGDGLIYIIGGGQWFKYRGGGKYRGNLVDASYTFTKAAAGQLIEDGCSEILLTIGDGLETLYLSEWSGAINASTKTGTRLGTWIPKILIETLYDGHTIDIIDFNGEGHLDKFSAEMKLNPNNPGSIRILLGDGKREFYSSCWS